VAGKEQELRSGEKKSRALAVVAVLALLVGFDFVRPQEHAVAASDGVVAAAGAADDQRAATISDDDYHHCLTSDYDGHVVLSACAADNYSQQWQGAGATLVNMQTGLCLDGNEQGDIYTKPCDPNQQNAYQTWGKSDRAIGSRKTELALTATSPDHVMGASYLDLGRQHWTTTAVAGACGIEPLSMVVDKALPDTWTHVTETEQSPEGLGGPWQVTMQQTTQQSVSAQTSVHLGVEFPIQMLKVSASADLSVGVTSSKSVTITTPFGPFNIPRGQVVYATYGVHMRHLVFHWHRGAKDCTDLDSGQYTLDVPFAQGFDWSCELRLDPDCKQKIEDANPGTTGTPPRGGNGLRSAAASGPAAAADQLYYYYDPTVRPGPASPPPPPQRKPTSVSYTGARSSRYHAAFVASARVTSAGSPVGSGTVTFTLGSTSCTTAPGPSGTAACQLTPKDPPGQLPMRVRYSGTGEYQASSTDAGFTILKAVSNLKYTGAKRIANGEPVQLSGVLTEGEAGSRPIADRRVALALGTGTSRQMCTATTDVHGVAACTIPSADQPLTDDATVPVSADFAGDRFYLTSGDSARARLEYYTGQATGLTAAVNLPLVSLSVGPTPDTGPVRTARESRTDTSCTASAGVVLVHADALCPQVTTHLRPGTAQSTVRVADVNIGLPGLPVIGISGLTATSTSTCAKAVGSATMTLTMAGRPVAVPTAPNSTIALPGGARIVVDEQSPAKDADSGLTVTGVHIVVPGGTANLVDISVGTATSAAHNCR
jgi:hypothetical protein